MKYRSVIFIVFLSMLFSCYNLGWYKSQSLEAADNLSLEEPKLVIGRSNSMPVFKSGEESHLIIPIQNIHDGEAQNINVSLLIDDVAKFPFELEKMSLQTGMSSIGGHRTESAIFFDVKVASTAESKIYPIGVKVDYTSQNGNQGQSSGNIYVKIENEQKTPGLILAGIQMENEQIDSGESQTIELKIKNDGHLTARDIAIKLAGFTANGLRLDQPLDTFHLKEFKGQEFKYIPFKIYADPAMESGTYPLDLIMKYKDEFNKDYSKEEKLYLTVEGSGPEGKNKKATPRLIINNYFYGGEYAVAGEVFSLSMSLFNTSQVKALSNIKLSLSSEENIFSPVNSSNSIFIDNIPAAGTMSQSIKLKPKMDAANKTYNITVDIEYEDEKGNKYTAKELIGIPVAQPVKLIFSDIEAPPQLFAGTPVGISLDFYNTGRTLIRNLIISTEGDFDIQDGNVFVGNLEAGKSDYYDVTITPSKEGKLTGKVLFDYDDDTGKHYQVEKSFKLEVMKAAPPPADIPPPDMEEAGAARWKKPAIIGSGILVVAVTAFILRRRQLRKKEEVSLDE
ncbi:COG1361 S-layer family protein [Syntrophomonas wolfei]|uniref:S-layer domain-like protein n=1 Tax=Syntrophomonas wolfei subsp. wolfei (strain DSM 2245B / Goettingen) TaxID=335541 RepID=Q0AYE7_SYNWW|nr:S-layer-like domain-containing protein [Syntrophomonas wolfei]ABI68257.1 S-layer domain-like protein [Syntrophomonas wolfei subsp. wolfei str. Goettingen G311]